MNNFKKLSLIIGWVAFTISFLVYMLTLEPTNSLWDCSEFIATSYKMEVGHPPGAPLFMMINRIFSIFAPEPQTVAFMVNTASAMASALTIAFMFWTVAHLGRRLLAKAETELSIAEIWAIMGAAFVGSMAYAFTDTFWFSAVEGEVYAQSSLFTALVFWAILKWENIADQPHSTRWLILIAYLMGLSIGVHLLNLLAIPALVFVYYYKMYPQKSKLGWWKAFGVSIVILVGTLYGIVPMTVSIGAWFDRIFVNNFSLPVNSGLVTFVFLLLGAIAYGVYLTHKKGKAVLNTILLCVAVMVIGYGSYASVVIRANVNPPMNSNAPSDPYSLLSLLNRDQYGNRPLVSGQYYSTPIADNKFKTSYYYNPETKKYVEYESLSGYEYDSRLTTLFPRMYSSEASHIEEYKHWADIHGRKVNVDGKTVVVPTFGENLKFFFNYQLNFMYWRYFLWNFVGRQNDNHSTGELTNGNWISGIPFIDQIYLGPQTGLPDDLANNKGRNQYYFLPFILGLIGLTYQLQRDRNNFTVVMWLFIMTGLAIIFYLNQTPLQPRERDYAYAGSFYAFSIWIGLGALCLFDFAKKKLSPKTAAVAATAVCLSVPTILLAENWDDHTRANRYVAHDFGINYLESTLPNSIIMPYGDNDTFPLWYAQEVEGVRGDVKVMNLSYLGGEWYVDQMKVRSNDAAPVPFSMPSSKYNHNNDIIPVADLIKDTITVQELIEFIKNDNNPAKKEILASFDNQFTDFIPARNIAIPVNKANAIKSGIVKAKDADKMVDTIVIKLTGNGVTRTQYMILDMLANFDWLRPIYVTQPSAMELEGISNYMQADGFAYRIVPIYTPKQGFLDIGRIDTEFLYDNLMNKFKYGNIKDPNVNVDYFIRHTVNATQVRNIFARLAKQLLAEGDTVRARKVLDKVIEEIPFSQVPHSYTTPPLLEAMYAAGETEKANKILLEFKDNLAQHLEYYNRFSDRQLASLDGDISEKVLYLRMLYEIALNNKQIKVMEEFMPYRDFLVTEEIGEE